ncbi:hypothetical protein [Nonomuraea sp. NPDC046570]
MGKHAAPNSPKDKPLTPSSNGKSPADGAKDTKPNGAHAKDPKDDKK